ncbi:MAG: hypothetical protein ACRCSG_04120 [Cellulosilyticaceae bacterium]
MKTLRDISEKMEEIMDSRVVGEVKEFSPAIVSAINPLGGLVVSGLKQIMDNADKYKLSYLLQGLASGLNQEMMFNELYNYINNPDKAYNVSSIFRKTLLNNSKIACFIMGVILSELVNEDKEFTQEELIIYNALDNATDIDLNILYKVGLNNIKENGEIDISDIDQQDKVKYEFALEYFLKQRVISRRKPKSGDFIRAEEPLEWNEIAEKLKLYLDKAKTMMRYS